MARYLRAVVKRPDGLWQGLVEVDGEDCVLVAASYAAVHLTATPDEDLRSLEAVLNMLDGALKGLQ